MNNKINNTRTYIFEAFYLLLSKNKYDDISVCDICAKAGVSRMSFYRNFVSKEDLIMKGLDLIMTKHREEIESHENITHFFLIKNLFETFKKYKDIIPSLQGTEILKTIRYNAMYKLKEEITIDQMNKTSKYIPIFYISALSSILFEWLKDGCKESSDDMASLIIKLVGSNFPSPCH